jgi:hypothetical protein
MARDFASRPPSRNAVRTIPRRRGIRIAKTSGASVACAIAAESGAAISGQANATTPMELVRTRRMVVLK